MTWIHSSSRWITPDGSSICATRRRGRCFATTAGTARTAPIEWLLFHGDFALRKFEAPPPDIIFFDPFSFKTDSALWTLTAFRELAIVCNDRATELYTYTYSTSVRAAMLAAGFYVAKGRATGPKGETTIGLSARAAAAAHGRELLGQDWLAKWARSDAQVPFGSSELDDVVARGDSRASAVQRIKGAAQMNRSPPPQNLL